MSTDSFDRVVPQHIREEVDRVMGKSSGDAPHSMVPEELRRAQPLPGRKPPLGDDMVLLPKHYSRFEIEPIMFVGTNKLDWFQGNIIKYTCRAPFKHRDGGKQDLLKVVRYAMMYVKFLSGDRDWWRAYRNVDLQHLIEEELDGPKHE